LSSRHRRIDWATALIAAVIAALAVLALLEAHEFSAFGAIFPMFVGGALLLSSLALLVRTLISAGSEAGPSERLEAAGLGASLALIVVLVLWVLALEPVGFAISSWLGFVVLALIADRERPKPVRLAIFAGTGLSVVGGLQLVFQYGLKVRLPAGELLPQLFG